jgi:hypothetical protein
MQETLSDTFHKLAGVWEGPPAMVARIQKNVINVYAASVMYNTRDRARDIFRTAKDENSNQEIANLKEIFTEAKKHTSWPPIFPKTITGLYNIDLTGWKYLKSETEKLLKQWFREDLYDTQIKVSVVFEDEKSKNGQFDPTTKTISIYIDNDDLNVLNQYEFKFNINRIKRTVAHECEHFGQTILSDLLRKKRHMDYGERGELVGLPSPKLRSKKYDFHGRLITAPNPEDKIRLEHPLRDEEFYPNLKNAVNYFIYHLEHTVVNSTKIKKEYFKSFVGEKPNNFKQLSDAAINTWKAPENIKNQHKYVINSLNEAYPPFDKLQKFDLPKWKAAVKIFYNTVSHLLN